MKKFIISLFLILSTLTAIAGGGKLLILVEESNIHDGVYLFTETDEVSYDFHKRHWKNGRDVISAKNTPFGWCLYAGKNYLPDDATQKANYDKTKNIQKWMNEMQKDSLFVTSLAFGQMDGMGRSYWQAIVSTKTGYTDQVYKEQGFKSITKWAMPYMEKGYRITDIAPSTTKWFVVLSEGTDINKQAWAQYDNYDEFVEGLNEYWSMGYSLQIAEVSPSGKYVGVFCTYNDGRTPKQIVTVVSTAQEANDFIQNKTGGGMHITRFGGSYLPGLLCNYDSAAEKANVLLGLTNGMLSSGAQLAAQINENKQKNTSVGVEGNGDGGDNIPQGLSAAEYQGIYDRYARNAESIVNSLTGASQSGSTYTTMKKQLRTAQKSMRKTREEARRAGHTITQSKWETANVSL